ncbi:hypothetical protein HK103_000701 [Boothiomyces macroporosus]|uniref:Uncharacterized protein n=1 Tax=Boothiomyces macroporosus TaxID=261099 RepID=A0AAD5UB83_9FUNG|nr:hypothetical protein HK103_000701 [Boothiomyces macroporosus]
MAAHSIMHTTTHTTTTTATTTTTTTTTFIATTTAQVANALATPTQVADSTQQQSSIPVIPIILVVLAVIAAIVGYIYYRKSKQEMPEPSNIKEISQPIDLPEIKDIQLNSNDFRVSQLLQVVDGNVKIEGQ